LEVEHRLLDATLVVENGRPPASVARPEVPVQTVEGPSHDIRLAIVDHAVAGAFGLDETASLFRSLPGLPIMLTSCHPGSLSEESIRSVGIREVLTKPIKAVDLIPAPARLIEH
jgi:hypothetical protein